MLEQVQDRRLNGRDLSEDVGGKVEGRKFVGAVADYVVQDEAAAVAAVLCPSPSLQSLEYR